MALSFDRRHLRDWKVGHAQEARTSEYDELKEGMEALRMPHSRLRNSDRKFRRQTTGKWEWKPAKTIAQRWDAAGSWDAPKEEPPPPVVAQPFAQTRIIIDRAVRFWESQATCRFAAKRTALLWKKEVANADRNPQPRA